MVKKSWDHICLEQRRSMIAEHPRLSLREQCRLLGVHRLQAKGFPLGGLGGRGNAASDWADYFRVNSGTQDKAFEAVLEAARAIDVSFGDEIAETGTTITRAVWQMIIEDKFTPYP